jgi:hypothetical protein
MKSRGKELPAKKTTLTDAERAKRMRDLARESGTDNDPASFDRAFDKVVRPAQAAKVQGTKKTK